MSAVAHFFVFFAGNSKRLITVWAKQFSETEGSCVLSEDGTVNRRWSNRS